MTSSSDNPFGLICPPRWGTLRTPDRPTLGPRVGQIAAQMGKPFMPHQQYVMDVALELLPNGKLAYSEVDFILNRQNGKAIDTITPMWTTRGWVTMADIQVGDYVYHPDGHPIQVTMATVPMLGHDCYRVTTTDGRSVIADADHLWHVFDRVIGQKQGGTWRTLTTVELLDLGVARWKRPDRNSTDYRFRLPVQRAVKTPDVELPLDPYFLGMWLGDGTTANASMTVGKEDLSHVQAEIERAGYRVVSTKADKRTGAWALWINVPDCARACDNCGGTYLSRGLCKSCYRKAQHAGTLPAKRPRDSVMGRLRALGLLGNKHVPERYLVAGHDQRLALLQGLMDTDGGISIAGQAEFSSTRKVLCESVLFLARSLGWRATMREGVAKISGRVIGPKWRVMFTPVNDGLIPFRMARKAARVRSPHSRGGELHAVSIKSIERVESRPVRCIKVDSPDGLFLAGRDLMATHNTEALLPLMTHRALGFGTAQRIMYTTQTGAEARKKWEDIHVPRLLDSPFKPLFTVRKRLAAEAILWTNGSAWSPGSTTAKTGGTGDTLDLGIIDEAWSREDNRTELGMRPAMLTRPNHQLWVTSMIPGLARSKSVDSQYLKAKIQAGRARVESNVNRGTAFFMWAAAEGADPGDPATWWNCMPALGHMIDEDSIRADYEAMELIDFNAEYLGWWADAATAQWLAISELTWNNLHDPASGAVGAIAICVDTSINHEWTSISMAGLRPDGNVHVELIDRRPGVDWVVQRVVDIVNTHDVCVVVIDPNGPAASLIVPIESRTDVRSCPVGRSGGIQIARPNIKESAASCARLLDMTNELQIAPDPDGPPAQRVYHLGQPELTAAVAGAHKYTFGDQWRWARTGAAVDLSPLYSVTHAAWGLAVYRSQDYNVLDSVF